MKIVIFCGGLATRFSNGKPGPLKPLIKVNNKPILEHVMDRYQSLKNPEFILLGGYKFKELEKFKKKISKKFNNVEAINTGKFTNTAGRLLKIKQYLGKEFFCLTYGDTITDYNPKYLTKKVNKNSIISLHKYKIPYGVIEKNKIVTKMVEKKFYIFVNAGHYYLDPLILNYIKSNNQSFEKDILPKLIKRKIFKFNYKMLKKWYPIDNKIDLNNAKLKIK